VAESFAVLRVTGSVGRLGLVLACQSAVALLFTLAGGLAGDRFPRAQILTVSLLARMLIAAVLGAALLAGAGSFGLLLAAAGAYGCADGFFGPASVALLPDAVPRGLLAQANGLAGGASSSAGVAAPAAAGVAVAAFGPGFGFVLQASVLAVAAGCMVAARLPAGHAPRSGGQGPRSGGQGPMGQIRAGWAEFSRLRWLWLLTAEWTVFSMVIVAPVAVLGPALAERYLGGPLAWGVIVSSLGLGAVCGQLAAGRLRPARPAFAAACLVPVMTAEALALGLGGSLAVVAAAAGISGLAMGAQAVIFQTAMQTSVSPAVLARVAALDLLGSQGGQPIGYALAGPVSLAIGANVVLAAAAAGMFLVGALVCGRARSLA
jgi:predicted MFS family arabinose efflux permease